MRIPWGYRGFISHWPPLTACRDLICKMKFSLHPARARRKLPMPIITEMPACRADRTRAGPRHGNRIRKQASIRPARPRGRPILTPGRLEPASDAPPPSPPDPNPFGGRRRGQGRPSPIFSSPHPRYPGARPIPGRTSGPLRSADPKPSDGSNKYYIYLAYNVY